LIIRTGIGTICLDAEAILDLMKTSMRLVLALAVHISMRISEEHDLQLASRDAVYRAVGEKDIGLMHTDRV